MVLGKYVLAIDQGTTGTTVILFDRQSEMVGKVYQEFTQYYPKPGWVEHDALEIWAGTLELLERIFQETGVNPADVAAIGVTNQRETMVLWDRKTGEPVTRAIVWQCRRTAGICDDLRRQGLEPLFKQKTGLILDAYFSGTKLKWVFDHRPELRERAGKGELAFGTIDSWLIYKLTGGQRHITDYSNASRTLLFNIADLKWDCDLLDALDIPEEILPEVVPSSAVYGHTAELGRIPAGIPIAGAAGDQQAALFGQTCFEPGTIKATFGTGAFILMNTGSRLISSDRGLVTTVAWGIDGKVDYALEGSVFVAGAAVQWLRDELGLIKQAAETEALALSVPDTNGVYFVPSFVGLGAPHWEPYVRGMMMGITRGVTKSHLVRATLEAIVFQTKDVVDVMAADAQLPLKVLKVDGGASVNNFICQFLADLTDIEVQRPRIFETTALGAAYLAGLAVGFWNSPEEIREYWQADQVYKPEMRQAQRLRLAKGWDKAIASAKSWVSDD
ncbi:MAG: glycerol kinase GlpK [Bacillota bacterium]|jgi:glycerol kinase|nr:glycerol kinase GlpK [Bacillota bacterium]NLJ03677.1 glycerol kinase GlpK [Bacillota bacterium]